MIKDRILVVMAITLFACVPMVQLVTAAPGFAGSDLQDDAVCVGDEIARGWNLSGLGGRFSMPGLPVKKNFSQFSNQWKELKPFPQKPQRTLPTPPIPVFNITPLFPEPEIPETADPPVYISDLNVIEEYVKIKNEGKETVVMTGWKIANRAGKSITFIDYPQEDGSYYTFKLPPRRTVTIYSGREGNPGGFTFYWPEELWNDSGDTASLYNPAGELVSSLSR